MVSKLQVVVIVGSSFIDRPSQVSHGGTSDIDKGLAIRFVNTVQLMHNYRATLIGNIPELNMKPETRRVLHLLSPRLSQK